MKITIIGNSVALRVRPPLPNPHNKNYTCLLREYFNGKVEIENKALGATTITNWLKNSDEVVNSFADIYIINIGVVDATIREVPIWFYRLASKQVDNFFTKAMKSIYRGPISQVRPMLARIRGRRSWVSVKRFEVRYKRLCETILKETNATIIALPINVANDRIEKQLPGSRKNHQKFNEVIKKVTSECNQTLLELNDLSSEKHYPDGVHFSSNGHEIIATRLGELINEKMNWIG